MKKTFEQLEPGDVIIVPGDPKCEMILFRKDQEYTVEKKYLKDKSVKVKELGGVVIKMDEFEVKADMP